MTVDGRRAATGATGREGELLQLRPGHQRPGGDRILGLDAARALALLGMFATHIFPILDDDGTPSLAWSLFAGRAAALFVLLAGVGLALTTGGATPPARDRRTAAAASVATRAALLLLLGLALGQVVEGIYLILAYYGVIFVLAVPLIGLRPRVLLALSAGAALAAPFLMQGLRDHLPDPSYTEGGTYLNPTLASLRDPAALLSELLLTGVYPAIPLLVYLCAGLALGRLVSRVARDERATVVLATRLVLAGVVVALAGWWGSSLLLEGAGGLDHIRQATVAMDDEDITDVLLWGPDPTLPTTTWWWLAIRAPHSSTPFDLIHTAGTSVAAVGAAILVGIAARGVLRPVAMAGGMPLTLYCLHALAIEAGWFLDRPAAAFAFHVAGGLLFAVLWGSWLGRGPLERVIAGAARRTREVVLRSAEPASGPRPEQLAPAPDAR